ncbi:MAG: PAS domain S-box protein [Nitrosopumilus sp.]|nr:PAS domain S-box protein [Nitrosopumilus sp.]
MKIRTKLALGLVIIIGIFVAGESYSSYLSFEINSVAEYHNSMSIPALIMLGDIETSFNNMNNYLLYYTISPNDATKDHYLQEQTIFLNHVSDYETLAYAKNSLGNDLADDNMKNMMNNYVDHYEKIFDDYILTSNAIIGAVDSENKEESITLIQDLRLINEDFQNILDKNYAMENTGKELEQNSIRDISDKLTTSTLIINILLGLASISIVIIVSYDISKQVGSLKQLTTQISKKQYDIVPTHSKNEFDSLRNDIIEMGNTVKSSVQELENFRRALDNSASVTITNPDGVITFVNEQYCDISKFSRDELIGKTHKIVNSGYHPPSFFKSMWNTLKSGNTWSGEIKNRSKDGSFHWGKTVITPVIYDGNAIHHFIEIRTDITPRIKLQQKLLKQEKLVTIGELSARLAHDIRNPLSIIQVSLENLKLMSKDTKIDQKHFDRVERAINRISHQIEDVLGYIRNEPMQIEKTNMSEIIADALDSINLPNSIYFDISKNDFEFYCDKKRLAVALTNLIINGIQAIDGKGEIKINCEDTVNEVVISVQDSGKGIPADLKENIFEPLFTTKQQGTGLGLASVASIVQGHHGTISVTSPPTTFTITLPKNPSSKDST